MKVALVSSYDESGGAGRAAGRLHQGLRGQGVDSDLIVQQRGGDDAAVFAPESRVVRLVDWISPSVDFFPLRLYKKGPGLFWLKWMPGFGIKRVLSRSPDVVNLHSFQPGFIRLESVRKFRLPLVWTMHDKWCLTGGCHFSGSCTRYEDSCGKCPQLSSDHSFDLSRWSWNRKRKVYPKCNLTFVAPSKWLADCVRRSSLLGDASVEVIPNGIDLERFRPVNAALARDAFQIPDNRPVVLFGAESATTDPRKGFQYVRPMLEYFRSRFPDMELTILVFGASRPTEGMDLPFGTHFLGRLRDDVSLRMAYSAADVFLCPSEEDNLPLTVIEAMACGTPTVAFRLGGLPDLVDHTRTGYLANPFDVEDLAEGVKQVIDSAGSSRECREKAVREFDLELQACRYKALFESIISRNAQDRQPDSAGWAARLG